MNKTLNFVINKHMKIILIIFLPILFTSVLILGFFIGKNYNTEPMETLKKITLSDIENRLSQIESDLYVKDYFKDDQHCQYSEYLLKSEAVKFERLPVGCGYLYRSEQERIAGEKRCSTPETQYTTQSCYNFYKDKILKNEI